MSDTPETPVLIPTERADLFFENNSVGRLKKEIWEASDDEIDAVLAEYGVPSPVEWGKPGSYIQTTIRWQVEENRRKNDIVFMPIGCTELHGAHLPSASDTLYVSQILEGVRRFTAKRGAPCNLALPPLNYGSHPYHHMGMPGTVVVRENVARELLIDVMLGLWNDGFRKQIMHQQSRSSVDAGVRDPAVHEAVPSAGHLPRHRLASGGARVLPHHGEGRQLGHQLRPRR